MTFVCSECNDDISGNDLRRVSKGKWVCSDCYAHITYYWTTPNKTNIYYNEGITEKMIDEKIQYLVNYLAKSKTCELCDRYNCSFPKGKLQDKFALKKSICYNCFKLGLHLNQKLTLDGLFSS